MVLGSLWVQARERPGLAAEALRADGRGAAAPAAGGAAGEVGFELQDEQFFQLHPDMHGPGLPVSTSVNRVASADYFAPFGTRWELPEGKLGEVSLASGKEVSPDADDKNELRFLPAPEAIEPLPLPSLKGTPLDGQAGQQSEAEVPHPLGPSGEYTKHLSAAALLRTAPKARPYRSGLGFRLGGWGIGTQGVLTKVGEYQDLGSSPFWDFDRLLSNGARTLSLYGTGLDDTGNQAGLYLFDPKVSVRVDYRRFLHRLDHDPLTNMTLSEEVVAEDLNVGDDYAIRVQNLKTYVKGKLTKNVKYRVNFWMLRKQGDRQAIGTQHCANFSQSGGQVNRCHVLSQTQQVDWLTSQVEPVVQFRRGSLAVQYARPMRLFGQSDQVVKRSFGDFHVYNFGGEHAYGVVPENFTQTDRIKISRDLPLASHVYGSLYAGNTHNKNRDTNRRFYGYDVRLTNRFWNHWTVTGFARVNRQLNQFPPFLVDPEGAATSDTTATGRPLFSAIIPQYGLRQPINYRRAAFGAEANWRPFQWTDLTRRLTVNFGFERGQIARQFADYHVQEPATVVDQDETPYTSYFLGTSKRWAPTFDTFVRYKGRLTENPLVGVNLYTGETNTSRPERLHRIEVGGSWMPADNLIATANLGIENRANNSSVAHFNQDGYPLTFTLWYAPSTRWSLSAGYAHFSDWIDQDIYFPSNTPGVDAYDRRTWNYGGTGQVANLGGSYAWSSNLSLSGSVQFVWARNAISPFEPWPDLPQYFDVIVDRTRVTGGVDWLIRDGISAYSRYVYDNYQDLSVAYNSGLAHMFLAGVSAVY